MRLPIAAFRTVLLLAVAISVNAQQPPGPQLEGKPARGEFPIGRRLTLSGVRNFGEVTPNLYRGGQPNAEGFAGLAKMGINIVVDMRGDRRQEREVIKHLGMQYVPIPWHCPHPRDAVFAQFLMLLRKNPDAKVFVHCLLGDDRTGMTIAAFRIVEQGWTAEEAKREMEVFGFSTTHHLLCPGLVGYEGRFPQIYRTSPVFESLRSSPSPLGPR